MREDTMRIDDIDVDTLSYNWWLMLLRGIVAVIFGILTFLAPAISLAALVLAFGAYAFADGVLSIVSAVRRRGLHERWGLLLLEGVAGVAAGIVTFFWPGMTALVLLYLIAAWSLVTGALEIAAAIRLRKVIRHEWLLALAGIVSIAFGVLLALFPGPGALALTLWIGAYALVFGAIVIATSIRLRSWGRTAAPRAAAGLA